MQQPYNAVDMMMFFLLSIQSNIGEERGWGGVELTLYFIEIAVWEYSLLLTMVLRCLCQLMRKNKAGSQMGS